MQLHDIIFNELHLAIGLLLLDRDLLDLIFRIVQRLFQQQLLSEQFVLVVDDLLAFLVQTFDLFGEPNMVLIHNLVDFLFLFYLVVNADQFRAQLNVDLRLYLQSLVNRL